MKTVIATSLLAGIQLAAAHSGVWNLDIDGNNYPARDTRLDGKLGAKRIEWSFSDSGVPWAPIPNVNNAGMACGANPGPPALKAVARAGAPMTVQWSGIVRTHLGPTITWLAPYTPGISANALQFFKIHEIGYDTKQKLWANEILIKNDRKNTFKLPSDLKPGMYTLRTELVALHYSSTQGPQVYPHCFNIYINGTGTATPSGVKFPGGYAAREPGFVTNLFDKSGKPLNWEKYVVPGPPVYAGKYDAPTGPAPVVSEKDRGIFPAAFQAKYEAFKKKEDDEGLYFNDKINKGQESIGHNQVKGEGNIQPAFTEHFANQRKLEAELAALRREAQQLGIAT
ncbi:hypothetical protein BT63DRAFT_435525 [Microthyrium microscopicum]|uniref:lytic cellulose monooxygenase (C4-dehydrogenating) n=1 Tax=Microthyrium microscopicum TaxID=703497 RepID=A0A6A6UQ45_9PEZI|nr:hypothetical protein BT63DRAFT_435525 [Microthyrium microscopicum]